MARLINADKVTAILKNIAEHLVENENQGHAAALFYAADVINVQPTVDAVEVVHGRWEWDTEDVYKCSNCLEKSHVKEVMGKADWLYCPNCGAKMRGYDDEQKG